MPNLLDRPYGANGKIVCDGYQGEYCDMEDARDDRIRSTSDLVTSVPQYHLAFETR